MSNRQEIMLLGTLSILGYILGVLDMLFDKVPTSAFLIVFIIIIFILTDDN